MLTSVQYRVLKAISSWPLGQDKCSGKVYEGKNKLAMLLGPTWLQGLKGKTVIDFGCGEGKEVIELARQGVDRVIGVDIRENILSIARNSVAATEVKDRCEFTSDIHGLQADVIVSIDAFEHFADPGSVLEVMHGMLAPGGGVVGQFWTNLVPSLWGALVFRLPLGALDLFRGGPDSLALRLQDRRCNEVSRGRRGFKPNDDLAL